MKSIQTPFLFVLCISMMIGMTSCVSSKKMIYLQGADQLHNSPQKIVENYELKIKPGDQLLITISSKTPELLIPFTNSQVLGTSTTSTSQESVGLLVDQQGRIDVPILGEMQVLGLTSDELSKVIKKQLIEQEYIKDPTVIVRFKGTKIVVLGEVVNPGVKELSGERVTILDAIGMAGDLPASARRDNILVIREENGERKSYQVNLTSGDDVLSSPVYYLQQNDVVYVSPNKSIKVKGSSALTYLSAGGSVVAVLASILSLIFVVAK